MYQYIEFKCGFPNNKFLHYTSIYGYGIITEISHVKSTNGKGLFERVIQASIMYVICAIITEQIITKKQNHK